MTVKSIVVASPHARNDSLETTVREALTGVGVARIRARDELALDPLEGINPDFVFFPHWSWLIPPSIHDRFECIIFHITDVPYGRGGSPLQNLIVRGHDTTVISALRCTAEIDAGPVYLKRPLGLDGSAEEILVRASDIMAGMIVDIVRERPSPRDQEGPVVPFARRQPSDGDLAPLPGLRQVYDHIRMLDADGYPAAFLETEQLHVAFREARLADGAVEATVRITGKVP